MLDVPKSTISRTCHVLEDKKLIEIGSERIFHPTHSASLDRVGWKIKEVKVNV